MNNQECKVRTQTVNVNSYEPVFHVCTIRTSKCCSSCKSINNSYAKLRVPDVAKTLNVKIFYLMSRTNETRHIEWHKTCNFKCRLGSSVCSNKKRWNDDKCRCGCKELIDKGVFDKGSIWNSSNYECKCDKWCDVVEYLDYEMCRWRKKISR